VGAIRCHRDFIVRQEGIGQNGCSYASRPTFLKLPVRRRRGKHHRRHYRDCIWTATSNAGWITITSDTAVWALVIDLHGWSKQHWRVAEGNDHISGTTTFSVKQSPVILRHTPLK